MLLKTIAQRAILLNSLKKAANGTKQPQRNSSHGVWTYRVPPPMPSKRSVYIANTFGGIIWFWILYHIATEPEHIYGEWPYIDPSSWSDEELGIPPDSDGPLKN